MFDRLSAVPRERGASFPGESCEGACESRVRDGGPFKGYYFPHTPGAVFVSLLSQKMERVTLQRVPV